MLKPNLFLFYVNDPAKSSEFYEKIFELKPDTVAPTFASFSFPNGMHFGLWSTKAQDFTQSQGVGHRSEIAFMVPSEDEIRRLNMLWKEMGVEIEQDLFTAVFGLNFVALDPDGHRIRVCLPD